MYGIASLFEMLLKAATALLGASSQLNSLQGERRKRVGAFFEQVSDCLHRIAGELATKQRPMEACMELQSYIAPTELNDELEDTVASVCGRETAGNLFDELRRLVGIPHGALSQLSSSMQTSLTLILNDPRREAEAELAEAVDTLRQAAGRLKAIATTLKTIG
jgi:hypothetical protein